MLLPRPNDIYVDKNTGEQIRVFRANEEYIVWDYLGDSSLNGRFQSTTKAFEARFDFLRSE